jgi:hypothetical protein
MIRRTFLAALALTFLAQPAMAQAIDRDDSDDGWGRSETAFALTAAGIGAGVALGLANSNAAPAPGVNVGLPSSDSQGGHLGSSGGVVAKQVAVPEPGTFALTLAGMLGLLGVGMLRRREPVKV